MIYATVLTLLLGVVAVALTYYRPAAQTLGATERESDVFAETRSALIGYAVRQGVFQCSNANDVAACNAEFAASRRLGEFPCPDTDNDGVENVNGAVCTALIGRIPWKTLGIARPLDRAGETLWYAVSANWVRNSVAINNATPGTLEIRSADDSVAAVAMAVILSPGGVIPGQTRPSDAASNYLDSQSGRNNAAPGTPPRFIAGTPQATFNDRLVYIRASEVVPMLETRLGNELKSLLLAYKLNSRCFCYPWADSWEYSGGIADFGVNRGRLPSLASYNRIPGSSTLEPQEWGTDGIPRFPPWLDDNDWHNHLFYIVARGETNPTLKGCLTCTSSTYLTMSGYTPNTAAVAIVLPGTPRNSRIPPAGGCDPTSTPGKAPCRPFLPKEAISSAGQTLMNNFDLYFDDAANRKNLANCAGQDTENATNPGNYKSAYSAGANCDTLTRPASAEFDRNRIFTLPPEGELTDAATICPAAGPALYNATPCHDPHGVDQLSLQCSKLIPILQMCSGSCRNAAKLMGDVPCRNNRSAAACPPLHAALLACSS